MIILFIILGFIVSLLIAIVSGMPHSKKEWEEWDKKQEEWENSTKPYSNWEGNIIYPPTDDDRKKYNERRLKNTK